MMGPLRVVVRTDASTSIGTGHLMRCLTLASALSEKGAYVSFICRSLPGNLAGLLHQKGVSVHLLPEQQPGGISVDRHPGSSYLTSLGWEDDARMSVEILSVVGNVDWLIVDHYLLDRRWEEMMKPNVTRIMAIDDLADRPHDVDLLLDQNLCDMQDTRYVRLVPRQCRQLLGPRFALLRREFLAEKRSLRERDGLIRRILVFFGGSDPTNETAKALNALSMINRPEIAIDVVVGNANPHREEVAKLCSRLPNATLHGHVDTMAKLMALADLAIGAGGTATWERCFLGLPSLTVIIADNQAEGTRMLERAGAIWNLGWHTDVRAEDLLHAIETALRNPGVLLEKGSVAMSVMGGASYLGAEGVVDVMLEVSHEPARRLSSSSH